MLNRARDSAVFAANSDTCAGLCLLNTCADTSSKPVTPLRANGITFLRYHNIPEDLHLKHQCSTKLKSRDTKVVPLLPNSPSIL